MEETDHDYSEQTNSRNCSRACPFCFRGNSGIGLATAKQFVNEGAYVFISGRRDGELAAAVKEIGRNVTGVQGDVSNLGDLDRLCAQIKREKGKLDVVFANAGVAKYASLGAITEELYDVIFGINVKGLLFTVQKALPLMPDGASIILNASIVASKGLSSNSVYSATKAAVRSFARTWTTDLRDRHIRVNAVSPGSIDTPGLSGLLASSATGAQRRKMLSAAVPLGRSVGPRRSPRPWCFSHATTAATSRERNCSWMAASHRCRLSRSGGIPKRHRPPQSGAPPMPGRNSLAWKAAVGALSVAASCSVAAAQGAPPPPAVSVTPVVSRQVTETIDYIGRLTAIDQVDIVARVPGFIEERTFTEGQYVKKGDLLFRIEQATYKAAVDQARATLAKAKATEVNTKLQLDRGKELVRNQNIPQSTVDQRQADEDAAQASVMEAQAALE